MKIKPTIIVMISLLFLANSQAQNLLNESQDSNNQKGIPPQTVFHFNFEDDDIENYYLGSIYAQNGWNVTSSYDAATVTNGYSSNGLQHLQISKDDSLPIGTVLGALSPDISANNTKALNGDETLVDVDILISAINVTDYSLIGIDASSSTAAWQIIFGYQGRIVILDDRAGNGDVIFFDTYIPWIVNDYFNLKVKTSVSGDYIKYYINDSLIYTSRNGLIGATTVNQVKFVCNNFPDNNEFASLDNLTIDTNSLFDDLIFKNGFE